MDIDCDKTIMEIRAKSREHSELVCPRRKILSVIATILSIFFPWFDSRKAFIKCVNRTTLSVFRFRNRQYVDLIDSIKLKILTLKVENINQKR